MNATEGRELPLHTQVRQWLRHQIEAGQLSPGEQVPTEPELMKQFGVSRTTVRRALHDLASAGMIDRHPGRGTFVREARFEQELTRLTGFVEDARAVGMSASAEVVTIEKVTAPRVVAEALRIPMGEPAIHIERVRLANRQPVSFDDSYFGVELGQRMATEELETNPFYSILEDKYGIPLGGADYVFSASAADSRVRDALRLPEDVPVLLIERTSYARADDEPILFEYLHYRGDRMRYRLRLER